MVFNPFEAPSLQLKNRSVMTRNRPGVCGTYPGVRSQYFALADELSNIGPLYMHADLIAFGRPFLADCPTLA